MSSILKQIDKVRQKLKKGPTDMLLMQKPFAHGMYRFSMFQINYYLRVREQLNIDYDSFMIIQSVVSHVLYHLNKKNMSSSYQELENEWDKILNKNNSVLDAVGGFIPQKTNSKLTVSSICLVTSLPKETTRRKVNQLIKKNILKMGKANGIVLGPQYKKIFREFVPTTTIEVAKLIKSWEKTGILKNLLKFNND